MHSFLSVLPHWHTAPHCSVWQEEFSCLKLTIGHGKWHCSGSSHSMLFFVFGLYTSVVSLYLHAWNKTDFQGLCKAASRHLYDCADIVNGSRCGEGPLSGVPGRGCSWVGLRVGHRQHRPGAEAHLRSAGIHLQGSEWHRHGDPGLGRRGCAYPSYQDSFPSPLWHVCHRYNRSAS